MDRVVRAGGVARGRIRAASAAWIAGSASGCAPSQSGISLSGSWRACVNERKSSGVRTKKQGSVSADDVGLPAVGQVELDRQPAALAGVVGDVRVAAAVREARGHPRRLVLHVRGGRQRRCALGVNVPVSSVPFAWAARWPGCSPAIALMASTTSSASVLMRTGP